MCHRNSLGEFELLIAVPLFVSVEVELTVLHACRDSDSVYGELGHGNYQDQTGATEGNGNLGVVAA